MWRGPSFPLRAGDRGLFRDDTDVGLIRGNILQILGTRQGERVMLPLFGSKVRDFIHEPLDHITCALLRFDIIRAIRRWEPRVILDHKRTTIIPYPAEFRVKADMYYYLRPRSEVFNYSVEISRSGGVRDWQG